MGVDDPPHERLKLEDNVGDVENGQKPFVAIARKIEVFLHASDFRIADIRPVEEGEQDYKTGPGQLLLFATVTQVRCIQSPDTNGGTCRSNFLITRSSSSGSILCTRGAAASTSSAPFFSTSEAGRAISMSS
jgi:hypothetical protein